MVRFKNFTRWPAFKLAFILIAAGLLGAAQEGAVDDEVVGKVTAIKGAAIAMQDALPRPLSLGSKIHLDDVVSTGKTAKVEFLMSDDAVFSLGPRSTFVIQEYFLKGEEGNAITRLMSGAIRVTSGKIAQLTTKPFVIETNVATIGVRGTEFWGGELDGVNQFALLDGAGITVTNKAGTILISDIGSGTTVSSGTTAPRPATTWSRAKLNKAAEITNAR